MKTKILLLSLAALLFSAASWGQLRPREIPKQIRADYRDTLRDAKKSIKELKQEGWEILPSPVETPVEITSARNLATMSNWGERLIIPATIRARLSTECKYSVHGKICDTGRPTHIDLQGTKGDARNYTTSTTADDLQGHSTHVGGIACAKDFGVLWALQQSGVYVQSYRKVLGDQGQGSFTWVENLYRTEAAEDKAMNAKGIAVVYNGSFGSLDGTILPGPEAALAEATKNDAYFVFAAGNHNGAVGYPGSSAYAITSAALDQSLVKAEYSCYGPQVNNAMPGSLILSTWKNNTYATLSGTSMASPFLYSCVVIAKSKWGPKLKGTDQMRKYLAWVAQDLGQAGRDDLYGWGLIYIQRILDSDPMKMPGYSPGNPGNPPPPPPNPDPIIPDKKTNTAILFFPKHHTQNWKTQGSQNSFKLACRFTIQVTSTKFAEDSWDALDRITTSYFLRQYMVTPNDNDYHDVGIWAAHFLKMYLDKEPEIQKLGLKITVTRVEGYDERGRAYDIPNPKANLNSQAAAMVGATVEYAGKQAKSKLKIFP